MVRKLIITNKKKYDLPHMINIMKSRALHLHLLSDVCGNRINLSESYDLGLHELYKFQSEMVVIGCKLT